jgi:hypothetical protein
MTGAFIDAKAAALAEIVVKFIFPGGWGRFDGVIRAVHQTVAAVETE